MNGNKIVVIMAIFVLIVQLAIGIPMLYLLASNNAQIASGILPLAEERISNLDRKINNLSDRVTALEGPG